LATKPSPASGRGDTGRRKFAKKRALAIRGFAVILGAVSDKPLISIALQENLAMIRAKRATS
jgi:hypothetical protein